MNRIDSFADAMTGWLAEYAQKQQVSKFGRCGESAGSEQKKADTVPSGAGLVAPPLSNEQRPIQNSCGTVEGHGLRLADLPSSETRAVAEVPTSVNAHDCQSKAESSSRHSGNQAPPAGIHLVPEPPAIPEDPEWSDSDTAREQFNNITGRS